MPTPLFLNHSNNQGSITYATLGLTSLQIFCCGPVAATDFHVPIQAGHKLLLAVPYTSVTYGML